jgi:hypothetical protein
MFQGVPFSMEETLLGACMVLGVSIPGSAYVLRGNKPGGNNPFGNYYPIGK